MRRAGPTMPPHGRRFIDMKEKAARVSKRSPTRSGNDLQSIPGVGPSIAQDLLDLGFQRVSDLADGDPEAMYERLCEFTGSHVDRCVLYVFRCATYYASNRVHDPELLKWWNWKDVAQEQSET